MVKAGQPVFFQPSVFFRLLPVEEEMKLARRVLVFVIILGSGAWLRAQTAPNLENGWKPYGSYDGSHLDTVNLMNGNLMLHAPLLPNGGQRGALSLQYLLFATSKD